MKHPKHALQAALDRLAKASEAVAEVSAHPDLSGDHADRIVTWVGEIAAAEEKLADILSEMPEPPAEPWKPGPQGRAILERIGGRDHYLELTITASGGRYASTYWKLVREGYVERGDHPAVKARGYPAPSCRLTDKGRRVLDSGEQLGQAPGNHAG